MTCVPVSPYLQLLRGRITLQDIPFTDRASRLLVFYRNSRFMIRLTERWMQWEQEVGHYRQRAPVVGDLAFVDENGATLELDLTVYPHAICINTRVGEMWIAFADDETLYIKL